jgi:chromate transporter
MLSPFGGLVVGAASLPALFVFFAVSGLVVFGSGLAIVPFLHGGVVVERHWLTEQQFLDAVAVSLLTPGPVVITVAFIGFLVAGLAGGTVAAVGVFLPAYLVVLLLAPRFGAIRADGRARTFASGVTAAAVGALLGAVVVMATRTLVDVPTAAIAVASLVWLLARPRVPEPLVLVAAAAVGFLMQRWS